MIISAQAEMSQRERETCLERARDRVCLVWGRGRDSPSYRQCARKVLFLEDQPEWIEGDDTEQVVYRTRVIESPTLLRLNLTKQLELDLSDRVRNTRWETIIVDAPWGWDLGCPGRMSSIWESGRLARPGTCVIIHDCDRPVEDQWSRHVFGDSFSTVERLRIYQV